MKVQKQVIYGQVHVEINCFYTFSDIVTPSISGSHVWFHMQESLCQHQNEHSSKTVQAMLLNFRYF